MAERITVKVTPTSVHQLVPVEFKDPDPDCPFCGGTGSHEYGQCCCTVARHIVVDLVPTEREITIILGD